MTDNMMEIMKVNLKMVNLMEQEHGTELMEDVKSKENGFKGKYMEKV